MLSTANKPRRAFPAACLRPLSFVTLGFTSICARWHGINVPVQITSSQSYLALLTATCTVRLRCHHVYCKGGLRQC